MSLERYAAYFPPVLHFGSGCRAQAKAVLQECCQPEQSRVFFVCSKRVRQLDITAALLKDLDGLIAGAQIGISHDPTLETVEELRAAAHQCQANVFLALGGGSVIDASKTAAFLMPSQASIRESFLGQAALPSRGLPLVALPTTAGTGAEITKNAVLTDVAGDFKGSIKSPGMVLTAALVDPDFTLSLPPSITADTGMDALTQAIESYVSSGANAMTQALAAEAVALLLRYLPQAWQHGEDVHARSKTAEGSMLSALAFSQSGLGAVHGLAHPIGHRFNIPHGRTCAILLAPVMAWNLPAVEADFNRLAAAAGLADARELLKAVRALCETMTIPTDFSAWGMTTDDHDYIIKNCRSGSMKANPRPMTDKDVAEMLSALTGKA
ncbi:MAG TPA: iron-containing alcohol dehydrogenase [Lentisphaeria bacterium]|nr:iron-containing alcohol dehydrogenase [Lentisphaeria bacterium]